MKLRGQSGESNHFRDPPLLEQSRALTLYLDSLFRDVSTEEPEMPVAQPVSVSPAPPLASETPAVETPSIPAAPVHTETASPGDAFDKTPFTCLRISVGNMVLAIPMSSLFGIRRMPDKPVRLPGSPPWVMGMLGGGDDKVQVIDLFTLLGTENDSRPPADERRHAVIIAEGRWAIACDAGGRSLRVDPALVRWSGGHARLPWLAGIVAGELCTLLDPTGLADWLDRGAAPATGCVP